MVTGAVARRADARAEGGQAAATRGRRRGCIHDHSRRGIGAADHVAQLSGKGIGGSADANSRTDVAP